MHLKEFFERWRVRRLLKQRVPCGKRYDRNEKIREFLPTALQWRREGFDGNQYSGYGRVVAMRYSMESGQSTTVYCEDDSTTPANPFEGSYYDKWIVDVSESIRLVKDGNDDA